MFSEEDVAPPAFEPKYKIIIAKRTVEAVQIWSVGPDGIDDGGINDKPEYGSGEKAKDDIRFIIRLE